MPATPKPKSRLTYRDAGVDIDAGNALVEACLAFARAAGYRKVTLWTQSMLCAARKLYEAHGFRKVASEAHESFGAQLIAETWDLDL